LGGEGSAGGSHVAVETPPATLERCSALVEAFSELKTDMMEEVKDIDRKLIIPAKLARDSLKPMKKAIKKREDAKVGSLSPGHDTLLTLQVDYERYKGRCETLQNKKSRSDRENIALNKHEADLERSTHVYQLADELLRDRLPKLNAATFSILPHLLANQIVLQNNLIGNLYTVLHQYSHEQGYPDPPPEPEEVIPLWEASFTSLRKEMEQEFSLLKTGKAVQQPMRLPDKGDTLTGLGLRNKVIPGRARTTSNDAVPTITRTNTRLSPNLSSTSENGPPLSLSNKPSYSSLSASKPRIPSSSPHLTPGADHHLRRTSTASYDSSYSNGTNGNGNGHGDYFTGKIRANGSPSMSPNPAAGKKKPPPPPPKKIGSFQSEYVTAMYDFDSHTAGDLSFREGDRIRVVKKTESSQDWWEGEIGGMKGSFPANYCK
jgi:amphiphysin